MKRFLKIFFLLFIGFTNTVIFSSETTDVEKDSINSIFFYIYNQEFDLAEKELKANKESLKYFTNNWLYCDLLWWKAISKNDQKSLNKLQLFLEKKLLLIDEKSEEEKLIKIVYINYLMRIAAIKKQNFRTLKYFFQINRFYKRFDSSLLNPFQKDLYNVFLSVFTISKNKYILFNKEDEDPHFKILENYANSNDLITKTMAQYFLIKIYTDIKETPKPAKIYAKALFKQYPKNKVFFEFNQ
jgi:hypothetical protein